MGKNAACADERVAVSLCLSGGQSHDTTAFPAVWEGVPKSRWLDAAVMDKAYDSENIRNLLEKQGVEAVIPPKANRKMLFPYDKTKYRMRQKVERFFGRIKEFRRIALATTNSPKPSWHSLLFNKVEIFSCFCNFPTYNGCYERRESN